jgi:DNA-binding NtrC family response regulator
MTHQTNEIRILVIDDETYVRDMLVDMLRAEGYYVEGARDGNDGLQRLEQGTFHLVVTDIIMPEKEGVETIMAIRKQYEHVPVIAISGGGRLTPDSYLNQAKLIGAKYIFKKPLDVDAFLDAVTQCTT